MKYSNTLFDKFNIVEFNNKKTKDFIKGFDITNIAKKGDFFLDYVIEGNQNLDALSYKIYGDASYYWTIILVNNIQDSFFDLPLSSEELKKIALDELNEYCLQNNFTDTQTKKYIQDNYYTKYMELEDENNLKRRIKIVRPEQLHKFITLLEDAF